jgi:Zn-dependent protease
MGHEQLLLLPLWYAVFLLSLTCHEAAHALVAWRGGDPTAYLGGQVTLNPAPHVKREPFGMVLVPLLSFGLAGWMMGWASAPYDPRWEDRHPRRAAVMAAAGPLANLVLAALGFTLLKTGLLSGWWHAPATELVEFDRLVDAGALGEAGVLDGLGRLASVLLSLNLLLFIFNLIPLPPLDGSSVLAGLFAPARAWRQRLNESAFGGTIGLVVAWYGVGHVFTPLYALAVGWLYGW